MSSYQPHPIEQKSYEIIDGLVDFSCYPEAHREIYKRVIHTTGDTGFIKGFNISEGAIESAVRAISNGALIWTDVTMVQTGLKRALLKTLNLKTCCMIHDPETFKKAEEENTTRAVAGLRRFVNQKVNTQKILIIGDAPTALQEAVDLALKDQLDAELIIGIPVGFVGTESSKNSLSQQNKIPFITNEGTRGGSTVAASIFNALMIWTLKANA
jgi:precorrin-8X/cobalt-precorrin-8 methylmutase